METLCFSHLRWDFVYQRPQHLLGRFRAKGRVHFWEEPRFEEADMPRLVKAVAAGGIRVLTPVLPHNLTEKQALTAQRDLLDAYLFENEVYEFIAWYYTPMALQFSAHLSPAVVVYDCMDELSGFQGAPPLLLDLERQLFDHADVVFAGGASLYASKRPQHDNVHLFPSSIDFEHFSAARKSHPDPTDHAHIPHPRVGFYGVLDERLDQNLLNDVAAAHPEWHFVLIGPTAKIREEDLPRAANLHYLGMKSYSELPSYLANWDVAMLPFARNASTRFISPTKTPEYLAAGKPVVSTPIQDVVKPYGEMGLVTIGESAEEFAEAIRRSLVPRTPQFLANIDAFLSGNSWDITFEGMWREVKHAAQENLHNVPLGAHSDLKVEANV